MKRLFLLVIITLFLGCDVISNCEPAASLEEISTGESPVKGPVTEKEKEALFILYLTVVHFFVEVVVESVVFFQSIQSGDFTDFAGFVELSLQNDHTFNSGIFGDCIKGLLRGFVWPILLFLGWW
jgi:hypothetical protein